MTNFIPSEFISIFFFPCPPDSNIQIGTLQLCPGHSRRSYREQGDKRRGNSSMRGVAKPVRQKHRLIDDTFNSREFATGDEKYNKRCPAVLGQELCIKSWYSWGAALCPCVPRIGNMSVLYQSRTAQGRRRILLVAGPYWPMMTFVTLPSILGLTMIVSRSGLLHGGSFI